MRATTTESPESGYSLMEVSVVLLISVAVMLIVFGMIEEATKATLFVESHNELAQMAQLPVNEVQTEVMQTRSVFQDDAEGRAYLANYLNGVATDWRPIANSVLPVAEPGSTTIVPDAGAGTDRRVGNILMLARQLPPLNIPFDHDSDSSTADVNFPADRYRFQLYYIRQDSTADFVAVMTDGSRRNFDYNLDLVETVSGEYADYFQLSPLFGGAFAMTSDQIDTIIDGLAAEGVTFAWDPGMAPNAAFYEIRAGGVLTLRSSHAIVVGQTRSMINLKQAGIGGKLLYSVAMNQPATGPEYGVRHDTPRWAVYDSARPAFPSGLEFKVVGSGSNTKVMMRLLLFAQYAVTKMDSEEGLVVSSVGLGV